MGLPSAPNLDTILSALLVDPSLIATSMNISRLPDGSYRISMYSTAKNGWLTGYGPTITSATVDMKECIE